ncbi:MAG TPA: OmpH family outer membrane protein [Bacteroidia bacterium]|nr:MAG: outer membrane chaperone Skp [Bacteroidetes bacterium OLB10]MBE7510816.1 OmpH family outer membrane protein [Bacteroidia bacterium]MBX3106279.1 OmpH family outer membrane protein [Bacteroidota bacterium]MCB8931446.1 OmpH family outer membrane protein [Bacteroidia bacterium]MCO5289623.1 OmpH family outer membrane protein [Bacteroidota bacterium]
MKNGLLIYCMLLTAAVAYLFYKVSKNNSASPKSEIVVPEGKGGNIVFINVDTLLEHYNYYKDLRDILTKKQDSIDAVLKNRGRDLEGAIAMYQKLAGNMSEEQRAKEEEQLGKRQQQLMQFKDDLLNKLSVQEDALQDSLHKHLTSYLKDLNNKTNYHFILGYQRGNGILLANDSLDITTSVIEGLNNRK